MRDGLVELNEAQVEQFLSDTERITITADDNPSLKGRIIFSMGGAIGGGYQDN